VAQERAIDRFLTGREHLLLFAELYHLPKQEALSRIDTLLKLVNLEEDADRVAKGYSGGMKRKLDIACGLLPHPKILFLDEPTIGLDLLAKQLFRQLLLRLNAELGTTVFLTSHDVADIEHVADRAIVVNHGSVIYDATVAAMRRELLAVKRVDVRFHHEVDLEAVGSAVGGGVSLSLQGPTELRLDVDTAVRPIGEVIDAVLQTAPAAVADLSVVDPPLEQVIGEIYRRPA
jgi:ABC-2 type transport system ATP-binding protein